MKSTIMKIQNTKEIELSVDDVTEAIMRYLNTFQGIPLDSEFKINFNVVNKIIPGPYPSDGYDNHVFDGVRVVVKT